MTDSRPSLDATGHVKPPAEVLRDVATAIDAEVTVLDRLSGGLDVGATRIQLGGRASAVLKGWPYTSPAQLDEASRVRQIVDTMRQCGYPTPACLGVGATPHHVWHVMEFVDAPPHPS